jgi:7,8-dihydro-6-hydroxymethylpterin-pyrophosphokinase
MSTRRGRGEDRTHLVGRQIDVDVLVLGDRVRIRRAVLTSPLEVLAIRQAGVDVVVTERDGAQPLEIKVEC